jgi:hypothetical protein
MTFIFFSSLTVAFLDVPGCYVAWIRKTVAACHPEREPSQFYEVVFILTLLHVFSLACFTLDLINHGVSALFNRCLR